MTGSGLKVAPAAEAATHASEEGGSRPGSPAVHSGEFHPCTPSPIHTQLHVLVKAKVCFCVLSCSLRIEAVSNGHGITSEALPLLLINELGDCMGAEYSEAAPAAPVGPACHGLHKPRDPAALGRGTATC